MDQRRPAIPADALSPSTMSAASLDALLAMPKAELHLHLEGSIEPATLVELAARHGVTLTPEEAAARYAFCDFAGFLQAFKWVTTFLHTPADYDLVATHLAEKLLRQNVVYAEVTLSVGVMLRRGQDMEATFRALQRVTERVRSKGLRWQWVFDAVRQFGPEAALDVARWAARRKRAGVVAFGMGGDELALPASQFRSVYDYARSEGLHVLVHAGEVGGPEAVRDAVELLGAERIGHGLAALHHDSLMAMLAARQIPLELCPTSNLRTGALGRQLGRSAAHIEDYPLRTLFDRGIPITLSTDDPAMFQTDLTAEYLLAGQLGFSPSELVRIAEMSFEVAFLPPEEKSSLLEAFRAQTSSLRLV